MKKILSYTPEENLTRIKMQRNTKFVLVEGEDDIPVYETAIHNYFATKETQAEFEVTYGGGKSRIIKFLNDYKKENFRAVLDLDFDFNEKIPDDRAFYLCFYSVENYYFSKVVLSYLIANITNKSFKDVYDWLNMDNWYYDINKKCILCLKYIYFYQKSHNANKEKWSNFFICGEKGCWKINLENVEKIIQKIKGELEVSDEEVNQFFKDTFPHFDCISSVFPGKMIFTSVYRYIKTYLEKTYPKVFCSNFSNDSALKNAASTFLIFNPDFRKTIYPVIQFLSETPVNI